MHKGLKQITSILIGLFMVFTQSVYAVSGEETVLPEEEEITETDPGSAEETPPAEEISEPEIESTDEEESTDKEEIAEENEEQVILEEETSEEAGQTEQDEETSEEIPEEVITGKEIFITDMDQFTVTKGQKNAYITVKKQKVDLTLGEEFEVVPGSYVKNINKGTAKVTFRGINGYGGTKTVSFKIGQKSIFDNWNGLRSIFENMF